MGRAWEEVNPVVAAGAAHALAVLAAAGQALAVSELEALPAALAEMLTEPEGLASSAAEVVLATCGQPGCSQALPFSLLEVGSCRLPGSCPPPGCGSSGCCCCCWCLRPRSCMLRVRAAPTWRAACPRRRVWCRGWCGACWRTRRTSC
jgi:hypothetical protein